MASNALFVNPLMADKGIQAVYSMRVEFIEDFDYSLIRGDLAKTLGWSEKKVAKVEGKAKAAIPGLLKSLYGSMHYK